MIHRRPIPTDRVSSTRMPRPTLEEELTHMDESLRQYQQDLLRAQISRRRFMTGAAMASVATFLAACAPNTGASVAPGTQAPTPSGSTGSAPSETGAAATASPTPAPSYQ